MHSSFVTAIIVIDDNNNDNKPHPTAMASLPPLELYIITFNCARTIVDPSLLGPHLFNALPKDGKLPDIVQFSLQEIAPIPYSFLGGAWLTQYYDQLISALNIASKHHSRGGFRYKHVISRNVGMTSIMLFAKEEAANKIRWLQTAATGVGVWEMGNKGAVGLRFGFAFGNSEGQELEMTLVAAHLAPMEGALERRNQDFENIVRRLIFANEEEETSATTEQRGRSFNNEEDERRSLLDGDRPRGREVSPTPLYSTRGHVFFAGDLNYRTSNVPPHEDSFKAFPQPAKSTDDAQHYENLLKNDQLSQEREAGRTLQGFAELPINFPPTYKYDQPTQPANQLTIDPNSLQSAQEPDQWTWARHRFPSWCDRVLYLPSDQLKPHVYTALPLQPTSDHRPVGFSVSIAAKIPSFAESDSRKHPPFNPDPEWRQKRRAAHRRQLIVGYGALVTSTTEGRLWAVISAGIFAAVGLLVWKVFYPQYTPAFLL